MQPGSLALFLWACLVVISPSNPASTPQWQSTASLSSHLWLLSSSSGLRMVDKRLSQLPFCGGCTTPFGSLSPHFWKLSLVFPISCTPISIWEVVFLPLEWTKGACDAGCLLCSSWDKGYCGGVCVPSKVLWMLCLWSSDQERAATSSRPAGAQSSGHATSKAAEPPGCAACWWGCGTNLL